MNRPMVTDKIKELNAAKTHVSQLEQAIASELSRELASLPAKFGFNDVASFIAAVKTAVGGKRSRRRRRATEKKASVMRRKRAKISDATRAEVKKLVEAGKTGAEIAKAVGISLPSVQNIKKALGLVKKAGK